MTYQAWSVVFGEQPSAAKWNILGTNDSHFNDLTTINYQTDANNSTSNATGNVVIQTGWGQVAGSGTDTQTDAVTLPTAYTTILGVLSTSLGASAADSTAEAAITDFGTAVQIVCYADDITTSGFTNTLTHTAAGTLAANRFYGYSWIATGII